MLRQLYENLKKSNSLLFLPLAIFSFGLIKFGELLSKLIYSKLDLSGVLNSLCDWVRYLNLNPEKLPQLLSYIISCVLISLLYTIYLFISRLNYPYTNKFFNNEKYYISFIGCALILNSLFFLYAFNIFVLTLWLITFISFLICLLKPINYPKWMVNKNSLFILFLFVVIQFFLAFSSLIFKQTLVENDFIDIPEKTILKNNVIVDNTSFINQHKIGGLNKYDPRTNENPDTMIDKKYKITLPLNTRMLYFLENTSMGFNYTYDKKNGVLSLTHRPMSEYEYKILSSAFKKDSISQDAIDELFYQSNQLTTFYEKRIYSSTENDFIKKNIIEITNQVKAGWFLYHHSWVLNPIHAIALGAKIQDQTLLYGAISTLSLKMVMELLGGINYQNYFLLTYLCYPLYFLLFLGVIYLIFRRIDYLLLAALLLSSATFFISDELIRLAPGLNPIRHFFDNIIFMFFYFYLKKRRSFSLFVCLILCLFFILWNKEFGFFLLLAISSSLVLREITKVDFVWRRLLLPILVIFMGIGVFLSPLHGINTHTTFMLLGITIPPTSSKLTILILSLINITYIAYIKFNDRNPMFFLSLSLFFYLQLEMIYFIWYPSSHHLLSIAATFIFLLLTWFALINRNLNISYSFQKTVYHIITLSIILYIPSTFRFYFDRTQFENIFKTHITYTWPFRNAAFKTTMEPELFIHTAAIINKYEKNTNMYLISKYDSILPIVVNKYNAIKAVNVALDLVSYPDIDRIIKLIKHQKPTYLFIDSDITRNFHGDILNIGDSLAKNGNYQESLARASVMHNMEILYKELKKQYDPIEKGGLITVYQKH